MDGDGLWEGGFEFFAAKQTILVGPADALGENDTEGEVDGIVSSISSIQPVELLLDLLLLFPDLLLPFPDLE